MKKAGLVCVLALVIALLLAGCDGVNFTITGTGSNTKIEAHDADDGATAETGPISVGKNRLAVVESALEKGKLRIDFARADVFPNGDGPADVIVGDVAESVTVGPNDKVRVALDRGDYVLQITAVGNTAGEVTVNIEKR